MDQYRRESREYTTDRKAFTELECILCILLLALVVLVLVVGPPLQEPKLLQEQKIDLAAMHDPIVIDKKWYEERGEGVVIMSDYGFWFADKKEFDVNSVGEPWNIPTSE